MILIPSKCNPFGKLAQLGQKLLQFRQNDILVQKDYYKVFTFS